VKRSEPEQQQACSKRERWIMSIDTGPLMGDHGTSHKGAERFSGPSRRTEPQVCMHTPHRRAAAPAICWSRMGEMCSRTPAGSGTRTRWVTERNAFAFQFITIAIKPGSNGTSRRSVMAGG
jgi:hypothetical protein